MSLIERVTTTVCRNEHWLKRFSNDAATSDFSVKNINTTTKCAEVMGYSARNCNDKLIREDSLGLPVIFWQRSVTLNILNIHVDVIQQMQRMFNGFGWCMKEGC